MSDDREWAQSKGYLAKKITTICPIHKIPYEIRFGCPKCKNNDKPIPSKPKRGLFDNVIWPKGKRK